MHGAVLRPPPLPYTPAGRGSRRLFFLLGSSPDPAVVRYYVRRLLASFLLILALFLPAGGFTLDDGCRVTLYRQGLGQQMRVCACAKRRQFC
jgi:hypothetical protein